MLVGSRRCPYENEAWPVELARLRQFGSEEFGLVYSFFRTRKPIPHSIGKDFQAVADTKKSVAW